MPQVNKDFPSSWVKYKDGLCKTCQGICCTMPLEVKLSDLLRLGLCGEDEFENSPTKLVSRLKKEGIIRSYRQSTGLFMMAQKSNDDCIFHDSNRLCTVYSQRPDTCRQFPTPIGRPSCYCPAISKKA